MFGMSSDRHSTHREGPRGSGPSTLHRASRIRPWKMGKKGGNNKKKKIKKKRKGGKGNGKVLLLGFLVVVL